MTFALIAAGTNRGGCTTDCTLLSTLIAYSPGKQPMLSPTSLNSETTLELDTFPLTDALFTRATRPKSIQSDLPSKQLSLDH